MYKRFDIPSHIKLSLCSALPKLEITRAAPLGLVSSVTYKFKQGTRGEQFTYSALVVITRVNTLHPNSDRCNIVACWKLQVWMSSRKESQSKPSNPMFDTVITRHCPNLAYSEHLTTNKMSTVMTEFAVSHYLLEAHKWCTSMSHEWLQACNYYFIVPLFLYGV